MRRSTVLPVAAVPIAVLSAGCAITSGATWTFPPPGGPFVAPGAETDPPAPVLYDAKTVAPGFVPPREPIVTHAFNFVGRGALGLIQAGDGDPRN